MEIDTVNIFGLVNQFESVIKNDFLGLKSLHMKKPIVNNNQDELEIDFDFQQDQLEISVD